MDQETLDKLKKAGEIAAKVRWEGIRRCKEGVTYLEVMDHCEKRIVELGGRLAWAQLSPNDCAAHYCPTDEDKTKCKEGDILKIDIGVHVDGWIGDTAMSVQIATDEHKDIIKASENALKAAIKLIEPGRQLWEIGEAQYSEAEAMGFTTVTNLCGHSLGRYKVHAGRSVPTYNNKDKTELQEGWQIAIEPFVTSGVGRIAEKGDATVFMIPAPKPIRSPYGRKILYYVKGLQGMPFTTRHITRKFGQSAFKVGMRELDQAGILRKYPPLREITGAMVSQTEHTCVVGDKTVVTTRNEDDGW
ncbi:MAG: type II methionyl aminopeptidase [Candidatus Nanoarchaeia archaeon]